MSKVKFYLKFSGRSPIEEFLKECSEDIRSEFLEALDLLKMGHILAMPKSRNLASIYPGLHELRLRDRHGHIRIFYFIKKNDGIYILHALKKKTQELPKNDIELIIRRIKEISLCPGKK